MKKIWTKWYKIRIYTPNSNKAFDTITWKLRMNNYHLNLWRKCYDNLYFRMSITIITLCNYSRWNILQRIFYGWNFFAWQNFSLLVYLATNGNTRKILPTKITVAIIQILKVLFNYTLIISQLHLYSSTRWVLF